MIYFQDIYKTIIQIEKCPYMVPLAHQSGLNHYDSWFFVHRILFTEGLKSVKHRNQYEINDIYASVQKSS